MRCPPATSDGWYTVATVRYIVNDVDESIAF